MDFNSRSCKKVDDGALCDDRSTDTISTHDLTRKSTNSSLPCSSKMHISTHDLTRRSTRAWCMIYALVRVFQLTTSRGGRRMATLYAIAQTLFQLTTSRGGRQESKKAEAELKYFNSRPHEEVDTADHTPYNAYYISTHDLTRRSTAIFTQKVFLSKSLFVLIAYNIFILH